MKRVKNFAMRIASRLNQDQQSLLVLVGRDHARAVRAKERIESLRDVEFKVFSQFGEDGIIQFLISRIAIPHEIFVECGVENYLQANTRFLVLNNHWRGVVIDACKADVDFIRTDPIVCMNHVTPVHTLVTTANINEVIRKYTTVEDIGLLSIDIDGNDYWVWKAIDAVHPRIVICEFNALFGADHALTIPYTAGFSRTKAHYSQLYFGASLKALHDLGRAKGYQLIGVNSEAVNAFFVRDDVAGDFEALSAAQAYRTSSVRESRGKDGQLTLLEGRAALSSIRDLPIVDLDRNAEVPIREVFDL